MIDNFEFKLTPAYCLYNGAAVLEQDGANIKFLLENPDDELLKQRLKNAFTNHIEQLIKNEDCPEEFRRRVKILFEKGNRNQLRKCVSGLYIKTASKLSVENESEEIKEKNEAAAVLLLDSVLAEAKQQKATDIHIEQNCIRFRVNGELYKQMELQGEKSEELVQRIKLLAGMNVLENRKSQDGHFVYGAKPPLFIRVSVMAVVGENYCAGSESVVLRLLDTTRIPLETDRLGFNEDQLDELNSLCGKKNGLILICGPTGAGKSTTAASLLLSVQKKSHGSLKIISLEDPPEYLIPGVTQIQIDESGKNTFDDALNHIFRQDPDVILIGEIRDEKSAAAAVRASMTGHLVFATLHTQSAAGAVMRLVNLGAELSFVCSVLRGVIIQELSFCKTEITLLADVALPLEDFYKNVCSEGISDECFEHCVNASEVLGKNIRLMKRHIFPVFSSEKRLQIHRMSAGSNILTEKKISGGNL